MKKLYAGRIWASTPAVKHTPDVITKMVYAHFPEHTALEEHTVFDNVLTAKHMPRQNVFPPPSASAMQRKSA